MARIIVVIEGGTLQNVYSDDPDVNVDLLDYDNMAAGGSGTEWQNEVDEYKRLRSEIEDNKRWLQVIGMRLTQNLELSSQTGTRIA